MTLLGAVTLTVADLTWSGAAGAPPAGALGLRSFEIGRPDAGALELADPSGNRVLVAA
ncbi:MAG: hypothetical protein ACR2ND_09190 [Solirubrobacteraceae bacterium]